VDGDGTMHRSIDAANMDYRPQMVPKTTMTSIETQRQMYIAGARLTNGWGEDYPSSEHGGSDTSDCESAGHEYPHDRGGTSPTMHANAQTNA
jgi:hypothetical protein